MNNCNFNHIEKSIVYTYNCTNLYYMHDAILIQKEKPSYPADRLKNVYFLDTPLYDIY